MARRNIKYIVGIDEVGRGCLAGPVTVSAVAIPASLRFKNLRDSKKLSELQRNAWFKKIKDEPRIFYAKASVYPKVIDRINISKAANLAATRALSRLIIRNKLRNIKIFLDGGLYLNFKLPYAKTVIKGDEKYSSVKLASIVAKVSRDRVMRQNHKKFPEYGFADHVGYGTKFHIRALKKHGICELHRLTFIKNFVKV